ncbi:MAG: PA2817 family protein [Halopseudomonas sp.]
MSQELSTTLQTLLAQTLQALEATGSEEATTIISDRFADIFEMIDNGEDYNHLAQDAVSNLITMHPNLSHIVPRLLLWQLGGTCLHFLSDEEINQFSAEHELH